MKKILIQIYRQIILIFLSIIAITSFAQITPGNPCQTFDNQNISNWVMHNTLTPPPNLAPSNTTNNLNANQTQGPTGIPSDFALRVKDMPGTTFIYNNQDFAGDYSAYYGKCLCFDYRVIVGDGTALMNPSIILSQGFDPLLTLSITNSNPSLAARFTSNLSISSDSGWVHVCAPISPSDINGNLPSNADGSWTMYGGLGGNDWDNLLQNVGELIFSVDVSGWRVGEEFLLDNICFSNCPDTSNLCCETFLIKPPTRKDDSCCYEIFYYLPQSTCTFNKVIITALNNNIDVHYDCINQSSWQVPQHTIQQSGYFFPFGTNLLAELCAFPVNGGDVEIEVAFYATDGTICRDTVLLPCPKNPINCCEGLAVHNPVSIGNCCFRIDYDLFLPFLPVNSNDCIFE